MWKWKYWHRALYNYPLSFILTIKLQNHESLAIQLSKLFIFDHRVILVGSFAHVNDMWWCGPQVNPPLSHLSLFSPGAKVASTLAAPTVSPAAASCARPDPRHRHLASTCAAAAIPMPASLRSLVVPIVSPTAGLCALPDPVLSPHCLPKALV